MPDALQRLRTVKRIGGRTYTITVVQHSEQKCTPVKTPIAAVDTPLLKKGKNATAVGQSSDTEYTAVHKTVTVPPEEAYKKVEYLKVTPRKLKNLRAKKLRKEQKEKQAKKLVEEVDQAAKRKETAFVEAAAPMQSCEDNKQLVQSSNYGRDEQIIAERFAKCDQLAVETSKEYDWRRYQEYLKVPNHRLGESDLKEIKRLAKQFAISNATGTGYKWLDSYLAIYGVIPLTRACEALPAFTVEKKNGISTFKTLAKLSVPERNTIDDCNYLVQLLNHEFWKLSPPTAVQTCYCKCGACSRMRDPTWIKGMSAFNLRNDRLSHFKGVEIALQGESRPQTKVVNLYIDGIRRIKQPRHEAKDDET